MFSAIIEIRNIIYRLNGIHIFIRGSHDYWLEEIEATDTGIQYHEIEERKIDGVYIVMCHYAMTTWVRSHFNSWQLFGHSHGKLQGRRHSISPLAFAAD